MKLPSDILFRNQCVGCQAADGPLCAACALTLTVPATCPFCSRLSVRAVPCGMHRGGGVTAGVSIAPYSERAKRILWAVKFYRYRFVLQQLAGQLAQRVAAHRWDVDALVSVPTHWAKRIRRGYGVTEVIGKVISNNLGVPVRTPLKNLGGPTQVGLPRWERLRNPTERFVPRARVRVPPRVILIDDVRTTGATLARCAQILRAQGARRVYSAVLFAQG